MSQQTPRQTFRILLVSGEEPLQMRLTQKLEGVLAGLGMAVETLSLPIHRETILDELGTRLPEVRTLIDQAGTALGVKMPQDQSLQAKFTQAQKEQNEPFEAVACMDPTLAKAIFPLVRSANSDTTCVGIEPTFHPSLEWGRVDFDDFVVPHPRLAESITSPSHAPTRLRIGGPLTCFNDHAPKTLDDTLPMLVVSFAGLDASTVEPLLFQLSLSHPEAFSLLFLPSGRPEIDDLLQQRAGRYGLLGKRPRMGAQVEGWIRGAKLLLGGPTPHESAVAVSAQVPQLLISADPGNVGDSFLIQHGLAIAGESLHTLAMLLEGALPTGNHHESMVTTLAAFETDGAAGVAQGIIESAQNGPTNRESDSPFPATNSADMNELEDIGSVPSEQNARAWSRREPKITLREIIIRQREVSRHVEKAESNLKSWSERLDLASASGNRELTEMAEFRLRAAEEIVVRLQRDRVEYERLRQSFAEPRKVAEADWRAVDQMLSVQHFASFEGSEDKAIERLFERLEVDDALQRLKARMKDS
jgi:hypothetical protein